MEPQITYLDTCPSTNAAMPADAPHGYAIACREQTAGRGQRGASWEAEPGMNVTMSVMLRPEGIRAADQFVISMHVALAVVSTLEHFGITDAKVKWPNDIYVGDRKICGILIENSLTGAMVSRSIAGIGLNVNQTTFRSPAPNPISMAQLTGRTYPLPAVTAHLHRTLTTPISSLKNSYLLSPISYLKTRLWRFGEPRPWVTAQGEHFTGAITDVLPSGHIVIAGRTFAFKEVWPADITDPSRHAH